MIINADDELWTGLSEGTWQSQTMTPQLLDAARLDPSLWPEQSNLIAHFSVTAMNASQSWAHSERLAFLKQGTGQLGLPAATLTNVASTMAPLVLSPPDTIEELGYALAETVVGVALDLIGAVPIVGPIVQAIGNFVMFLVGLGGKKQDEAQEYLPPIRAFSRDEEDFVMNSNLLPVLGTADWTGLFLPRQSDSPILLELDNGWLLSSKEHTSGQGLGFIPGTQSIHSATQALWHKKSKRARGSLAIHQDTGDFYAGPAQLMTAIESQVQRPSAALWSVDTKRILSAWSEHHEAVMTYVFDLWQNEGIVGTGLEKLNGEHRKIIIQQLVAPMHVGVVPGGDLQRGVLGANLWTPKASTMPMNIIEAFVEPWCERLAERQSYYLDTIAIAYANPNSGAFKNKVLRDKLEKNRALLLDHPARKQVDLRDVIDKDYKEQLFASTVGGTLTAPDQGKVFPVHPPRLDGADTLPDPPLPPAGGAPFHATASQLPRPGDGGAAAILGLGALGYLGWRWIRRRRRR